MQTSCQPPSIYPYLSQANELMRQESMSEARHMYPEQWEAEVSGPQQYVKSTTKQCRHIGKPNKKITKFYEGLEPELSKKMLLYLRLKKKDPIWVINSRKPHSNRIDSHFHRVHSFSDHNTPFSVQHSIKAHNHDGTPNNGGKNNGGKNNGGKNNGTANNGTGNNGTANNGGTKNEHPQFNSRFQSGNLSRVYVSHRQDRPYLSEPEDWKSYYLLLEDDINTRGYNQWFYFSIHNVCVYNTLRVEIVNFRKNTSLYQRGMKVAVYSKRTHDKNGTGWHRAANNIVYQPNMAKDTLGLPLYTLGFDYTFQYPDDTVYFAYAFPYTYTYMRHQLNYYTGLKHANAFQQTLLGRTMLGNPIILIANQHHNNAYAKTNGQVRKKDNSPKETQKYQHISQHQQFAERQRSINLEPSKGQPNQLHSKLIKASKTKIDTAAKIGRKEVIVIMARVHPSETMSSFVMQGFMEAVFSSLAQAEYLRSRFIIKIFPMVNPDGVIHGNSRTSLSGCDLNRRWMSPMGKIHPEIECIKSYLKKVKQNHEIFLMLDLHGHSKRQNCLLYGCCDSSNYLQHPSARSFNSILGKLEPNFDPSYSSFYVSKSKQGTARVVGFHELAKFSYTLESSFLGAATSLLHFSVEDYHNVGRNLVRSIAYFKDLMEPIVTHLSLTTNKSPSKKRRSSNGKLTNKYIASSCLLSSELKVELSQCIKHQGYPNQESDSGSSSAPSLYNHSESQLLKCIVPYDPSAKASLTQRKRHPKKDRKQLLTVERLPELNQKRSSVSEDYSLFNFKSRKSIHRYSQYQDI